MSMLKKVLHESSAKLREQSGSTWQATLITPGVGSSGTYSEQMLTAFGALAFPAGTKLWFKHPQEWEHAGERDPRDQWGYLSEDAYYEEGVGLVGKITVLEHWRPVVESLGTQASLSVYVMGEANEEGDVIALYPEVTNSVDIVSYPGRAGSGLTKKLEAARAASQKPGVTSAQEKEGDNMEEKLDQLIALFTTFVTESKAAREGHAAAEADADAIEEARAKAVRDAVAEHADKVALIDAAEGLLPAQRTSLLEAAKAGVDVAPRIAEAKAIATEAKAAALAETRAAGYRVGESSDSADYEFKGFGGSK